MFRYRLATGVAAVAFTLLTPFATAAHADSLRATGATKSGAAAIVSCSGFSGEMIGKASRPGNPRSDHPSGRAVDFMTSSRSEGDRVASCARKTGGVKYVLWRVADHYDHVHVSFRR